MRTYLILKEKAKRWNENTEIKAILVEIEETNKAQTLRKFSAENSAELLAQNFDRAALSAKGLQYERLDQLTMDVLFGVE